MIDAKRLELISNGFVTDEMVGEATRGFTGAAQAAHDARMQVAVVQVRARQAARSHDTLADRLKDRFVLVGARREADKTAIEMMRSTLPGWEPDALAGSAVASSVAAFFGAGSSREVVRPLFWGYNASSS